MPVFYLGPDGDDGHSGTRESPWKTLEQANKALRPGDTAVLLPGTYEGTIRPSINGRVNAPIVYRSEAQHQAVLVGNGGEPWPIELQEKDYITLEGLSVMPGEGGWVNASRCTHLAIQGCRMEKSGKTTPLRIEDSRHVRLIDNVLRKDRTDGNMCSIYRCTYGLFEGNALSHAGHNPFIFSGNNNAMIRSNSFHNPWGRNYALHASGKIVFERNIVTEALDSAHSANSPSKNSVADGIIRFNRVFRNWHTPLNSPSYVPPEGFFIRRPFGLVNTRLYNNTITGGLGHAWETGGISITSNVFSNNLFFTNDPYGEGDPAPSLSDLELAHLLSPHVSETTQYRHQHLLNDLQKEHGDDGAYVHHADGRDEPAQGRQDGLGYLEKELHGRMIGADPDPGQQHPGQDGQTEQGEEKINGAH